MAAFAAPRSSSRSRLLASGRLERRSRACDDVFVITAADSPQFAVDELAISMTALHIRDILMQSRYPEPFLVQGVQIAAQMALSNQII
jgi:hypothetical protein